nr:PREDICTED: carcinoembryonic antigen-related cell adhesion molecule 5-like [Latimeria chalumnae]|eukprot:XP_014353300.1 PREDICTED: carcinoembryonic antigen-related cell adhesion molecule 5-like [Latimeria chalumnae]
MGPHQLSGLSLDPPKHTRAEISPKGEIKEGSDVILTCKGDSNPRVNYIWLKDKGKQNGMQPEGKLILKNVTSRHDGNYYCCVRNNLGEQTSDGIRINMLYAPRDTKVVLSTDRIYEGEDVTLRCETQSNSPAHIAWYKNGILYKSSVSALRFKRISRWHSASYSCVVKNLVRRISSEPAHVNVLYAPRNTIVVLSNSLIQEGDDVALTCKTDSNPPAEFTWSKNGIQEMRGSGWTLQLYNVTTQATGNYSCTAVNVVGISTSQPVSLVLSAFAKKYFNVSVHQSPSSIKEGEDVNLTCTANTSDPETAYTWYKQPWTQPIREEQLLQLGRVAINETDRYYCTAQNSYERGESSIVSLNILYPPRNTTAGVIPKGDIKEGSDVTLTCRSDGNPQVNYTWFKEEGGSLSRKQSEDKLVFKSITSKDGGYYYCRASNKLGEKNSTRIQINVIYPPRNTTAGVIPKGDIKEGSDVTLTCRSDGNPQVNYTWFKEGGGSLSRKQSEDKLVFKSITSKDGGYYYCCANPPRNTTAGVIPKGDIKEGSDVTLTCRSDGNPWVSYTWFKEGGESLSRKQSADKLVFKSITSKDGGYYYCRASNKLGEKKSTRIQIDVIYPPRITRIILSNGIILEGDNVTLTCETDSNPPAQVTWYKNGIQYDGSSERTLQFYNIAIQDGGNYSCVAANVVFYCYEINTRKESVSHSPIQQSLNHFGSIRSHGFKKMAKTSTEGKSLTRNTNIYEENEYIRETSQAETSVDSIDSLEGYKKATNTAEEAEMKSSLIGKMGWKRKVVYYTELKQVIQKRKTRQEVTEEDANADPRKHPENCKKVTLSNSNNKP